MSKYRVYELAKEFHTESKVVINLLARNNYKVANHMSSVGEEEKAVLSRIFSGKAQGEKGKTETVKKAVAEKAHVEKTKPIQTKEPVRREHAKTTVSQSSQHVNHVSTERRTVNHTNSGTSQVTGNHHSTMRNGNTNGGMRGQQSRSGNTGSTRQGFQNTQNRTHTASGTNRPVGASRPAGANRPNGTSRPQQQNGQTRRPATSANTGTNQQRSTGVQRNRTHDGGAQNNNNRSGNFRNSRGNNDNRRGGNRNRSGQARLPDHRRSRVPLPAQARLRAAREAALSPSCTSSRGCRCE